MGVIQTRNQLDHGYHFDRIGESKTSEQVRFAPQDHCQVRMKENKVKVKSLSLSHTHTHTHTPCSGRLTESQAGILIGYQLSHRKGLVLAEVILLPLQDSVSAFLVS